ncbi:MAG: phosphoheptose isomerase, partial [Candidatus Hydrogenedentota bacterium]
TVPPATLDAFRNHGEARPSLTEDLSEAFEVLEGVKELGIDLDKIARQLQDEGVIAFEKPFESLMDTLTCKREGILAGKASKQQLSLGRYEAAVSGRLKSWAEADVARRIWNKDGTVWVPDPETAGRAPELADRLGWLTIPECMEDELGNLSAFAESIRKQGFSHVVLLGMGGSSLAPEVFMTTFGNAPGLPPLTVVDSTHPGFLKRVTEQIDLPSTLFIVSSKSGGTIETLSFFKYFYEEVKTLQNDPGRNFVVITDPGSGLEALAREKGLRQVFSSPPEVGGRYSALTYFGLVPAALIGVDVRKLLDRAVTMVHAAHHCVPAADNTSLALGAAMGELAIAGRDKVTFITSPSIASFGAWVEQLIAESTGKDGKGIVPVDGERLGAPEVYGDDRLFVYLRVEGEDNETTDKAISSLVAAGHPLVTIGLDEKEDLGAQFFHWEMATAAAGAILGINPFDQPNVEDAKVKARELTKAFEGAGILHGDTP